MTIGERIAYLRERRGMSQAQLAKELNIAQSTLAMWERGKRGLKDDVIKQLAEYFSVSSDYLLGIENENDRTPNSAAKRITAHIDEDMVEDQVEDIINYIEFLKQKKDSPLK